jgi:lipopolysaccharide/colanic/teichoic acid biosynthesis glycosyltransferase
MDGATQKLDIYMPEQIASDLVKPSDMAGLPAIDEAGEVRLHCGSWMYRVGKRILDLVLAILVIPLVLPICLALTLAIKCTSRGPVLYRHLRVGRNGRRFYLYKFRTMVTNSQHILRIHIASNYDAKQEWTRQHKLQVDPRVTSLGRVLRRTSLDELPQIVNVVLGDMSFVGPRPIVPEEIPRYGNAFGIYAAAKPGITGLWQVNGRGTVSYGRRISLDVQYVRTWSMVCDLKILLNTLCVVVKREGAY